MSADQSGLVPCWMVERQAYGGPYWDRITFGPFPTREKAEAFAESPYGGFVYDPNRKVASDEDGR